MASKNIEFLSVSNAAKELCVSKKSIYDLIKSGKLQTNRFNSRKILINREVWEEWKIRNILAK